MVFLAGSNPARATINLIFNIWLTNFIKDYLVIMQIMKI